jgi:hypothetical protein
VLKGYRTIVFNAIMLGIMILAQQGVITPEQSPSGEAVNAFLDNLDAILATLWGVGNVALRVVTNTPVGQKE